MPKIYCSICSLVFRWKISVDFSELKYYRKMDIFKPGHGKTFFNVGFLPIRAKIIIYLRGVCTNAEENVKPSRLFTKTKLIL